MPPKEFILDPAQIDLESILENQEGIRRYNPQRFEMEQVTAICLEDAENVICVGYKDVTEKEFWVHGHMPGAPLMPGVVICEAAAQVCSLMVHKHKLLGEGVIVGLGGLEDVRFRDPVRPGDRLVIVAQLTRLRPGRMCVCRFEAFVKTNLVCEGIIKGVALPSEFSLVTPAKASN